MSEPHVDELSALKQRADVMGIPYSNKIGIETLKERINEALEGKSPEGETKPAESRNAKRMRIRDEQLKLVRCRITNMNPAKRELNGEIITFSNKYVGNIRRFIPFGEQTDNGFHIEQCLYNVLKERKFIQIRERTDRRTNTPIISQREMNEFALEILPPLTEQELKDLAQAQLAAGSLDSAA